MALLRFLDAYLKVIRAEYLKGELPAVFIPALVTASTVQNLFSIEVAESILVFSLLYVTGFMINAVTDREVDLRYGSFKRGIGEATSALGDRRILALIFLHVAAGLVLTVDLARRLANPWLVPLVLIGVFFGLAYSVRPFSFKTRGVGAHAISLTLSAFTVPFLFLYIASRGSLDAAGLLVVGAFSVTAYSLEYANQAYDFTEDLEAGLATPVVRLGLRRSLRFSFAVFAVSLPLLAFSVAYLALSRPSVVLAVGPSGRAVVALGAFAAVLAGYYVSLRGMARIARAAARETKDSAELVERIRGECNYSLWQTSGVTGISVFALAVFLVTASTTYSIESSATRALAFDGDPQADSYLTLTGPRCDVEGAVRAQAGSAVGAHRALVRVELRASGESVPYATASAVIELPGPGESAGFSVRGMPLRLGGQVTAKVTLYIDPDFDGDLDFAVAESAVPVPTP